MRARSAALLLATLVVCAGCSRGCAKLKGHGKHHPGPTPSAAAATGKPLIVPHTPEAIHVDGEIDENAWRDVAVRSGPFHDEASGGDAIPYSDARFLRDDEALYVVLYAADQDLRAAVTQHDGPVWLDDAFDLRFTAHGAKAPVSVIDVSVAGVITDVRESETGARDVGWESGTTVGLDRDGNLNDDTGGDDEEWIVEGRIPFAALPGRTVDLQIRRCDTPKGARRRCGIWRGTLAM